MNNCFIFFNLRAIFPKKKNCLMGWTVNRNSFIFGLVRNNNFRAGVCLIYFYNLTVLIINSFHKKNRMFAVGVFFNKRFTEKTFCPSRFPGFPSPLSRNCFHYFFCLYKNLLKVFEKFCTMPVSLAAVKNINKSPFKIL